MTQNGLTIDIKIQSISDIVTNSSSEVFCTITSPDIETIHKLLEPLIPSWDHECSPTLDFYKKGEYEYDLDEYNEDPFIQIRIPYGIDCYDFYKAGLEAILDKQIGNGNYTINYAD